MKRTIILSESKFKSLNRIIKLNILREEAEENKSAIDDRQKEMKQDGIGKMKFPKSNNVISVVWAKKQSESKKAVEDGNVKQTILELKRLLEEYKSGANIDPIEIKKAAYTVLKYWSDSATVVLKKLTVNGGGIMGIIEPDPKGGSFCDLFGLVCKLYYFPELLELLYTDEFYEDLRKPFDDAINAAVTLYKASLAKALNSVYNGHNLKLLFPLEWGEFVKKRLGLKNGTIKPSIDLSNYGNVDEPNETGSEVNINDDDFNW